MGHAVKSIRFPEELERKLQAQADEQDRTFSGQVLHLLRRALAEPCEADARPGR